MKFYIFVVCQVKHLAKAVSYMLKQEMFLWFCTIYEEKLNLNGYEIG